MEKARGQATATTAGRPKYSVLRGLGVILREEGWRGFYRGHLTNLLHVAPAAAARFYSFEAYRSVPSPPARARAVSRVRVSCVSSHVLMVVVLFSGWCAMASRCRRSSACCAALWPASRRPPSPTRSVPIARAVWWCSASTRLNPRVSCGVCDDER